MVAVILHLDGCIDAAGGGKLFCLTLFIERHHLDLLARLERFVQSVHGERFPAGQLQRLGILPILKLQGQDPHPDQVAAVNPLETLGQNHPDPQEGRTFRCPVA